MFAKLYFYYGPIRLLITNIYPPKKLKNALKVLGIKKVRINIKTMRIHNIRYKIQDEQLV